MSTIIGAMQNYSQIRVVSDEKLASDSQVADKGVEGEVHVRNLTETLIAKLLESSEKAQCLLDEHGSIRHANRRFSALAEPVGQSLAGESIQSVFPQASETLDLALHNTVESNRETDLAIQVGQSNGFSSSIKISLEPIFQVSEGTLVLLTAERATGEQRLEHAYLVQFASAVERTTDSVLITNRNGQIQYVNPAFERLTGHLHRDVIGLTPNILSSGKHSKDFYQHLWTTILSGETFRDIVINKRKSGEFFYEELIITPVRDSNGLISHFVSTGRDVTLRQQQEKEHEALLELSRIMRKARDRNELLPIALQSISSLVSMNATAFVRVEGFDREVYLERLEGAWKNCAPEKFSQILEESQVILETGLPFQSRPNASEARLVSPIQDQSFLAAVPLIAKDQELGVLWAGRRDPILEDEVHLLSRLGNLVGNALSRIEVHAQTQKRLQRLTALHAIDKIITSGGDLKLSLHLLLSHVTSQLEVDAASILLLSPETRSMVFAAGTGFNNVEQIKESDLPVGYGHVGKAVLERRLVQVPDISSAGSKLIRQVSLKGERFKSYFVKPLIAKERVEGVLELFHRNGLNPTSDWISFFEVLATQASIVIDSATMFEDLKRSNRELGQAYDATIEGWAKALELRDAETEGHAQRVTQLTLHLARALGLPEFKMEHVRRGALLHDIGKLGIPDSILYKPGPLTDDEWEIMRKHPEYAKQMLSHVEYLLPALNIPYCHHEKWDGTGYPQGLVADQIPKEARVFAIVDVWDALRSDRPYRKAWTEEKSLEHIIGQREIQFDPDVVDVFCSQIENLKAIEHPSTH